MTAEGTGPICIRPVSLRDGFHLFLRAGHIAAAASPHPIIPPDLELRLLFDPRWNPFLRANAIQAFVALKGGEPVGRIVAIEDRAHLARYGDRACHFGFLEAIDETSVFAALIEAASAWARALGLRSLVGPYSFSINHEVGLLVSGFETPSVVRTPYHPPHYAAKLASLGFRPVKHLVEHRAPVATALAFAARAEAAFARWTGRERLAIRPIGALSYRSGTKAIRAVYDDAWAENWGAVPVSRSEAAAIALLMRPLARPGWLALATLDGKPIGALAMLPDVNPWLTEAGPRPSVLGWLGLARRVLFGRPTRARIALVGVVRAYRNTRAGGIAAAALFAHALRCAERAEVQEIAVSWMLEDNRRILALVEAMGGREDRRWAIVEKLV